MLPQNVPEQSWLAGAALVCVGAAGHCAEARCCVPASSHLLHPAG